MIRPAAPAARPVVPDQKRIEAVERASAVVMVTESYLRDAQAVLAELQPAYFAAQQRVTAARESHNEAVAALHALVRGPKVRPLTVSSLVKRNGFRTGIGVPTAPMDARCYVGVRPVDEWKVAVFVYGSDRARREHDFSDLLQRVRHVVNEDGRFDTANPPDSAAEFIVTARKEPPRAPDAPTVPS